MNLFARSFFSGLTMLAATTVGFAADPQWTFNEENGLGKWAPNNFRTRCITNEGFVGVSGKDCMLVNSTLKIDASRYSGIEFSIKTEVKMDAQIFFTPAGKPLSENASVRFPIKGTGDFETCRVDCSKNPLWTGTITTLRIDPTNSEDVGMIIRSIKLIPAPAAAAASTPRWEFNAANKSAGWIIMRDMNNLKYTPEAMTFTSGKDCMMSSPALKISADKFKTLVIVMKTDKACSGEIYFTAGQEFTAPTRLIFSLKDSDDWQTCRVNLAENALWTGVIEKVRVDPVSPAGVNVAVKSIQLLP